ncbi:MAG: hypothetical protein NTW31_08110 [Bacteroidetes bacterium]|nr:hypothetical protein [Bacteroidota bacterium]
MKRQGLIKYIIKQLLLLAVIAISSCNNGPKHDQALIPLHKGNFWKYRGSCNGKPATFRITVHDVVKQGSMAFAVMNGFPSDVLGGQDWEASDWGLLVAGNGQYYYKVNGARIDSIKESLSDGESIRASLVGDTDLLMEALYDTGQIFGEAAQLTRADGNYYWKVLEKSAYEPSSIRGLNIHGPFDRYTLNYKTIADDITMDVVPGIGIVRYRYNHNGTPGELDLKLIEAGLK